MDLKHNTPPTCRFLNSYILSRLYVEDRCQVSEGTTAKFEARLPSRNRVNSEKSTLLNAAHLHPMADDEGLVGLRGLHQDLVALEASRLRNIDRLWADLEARVGEFRRLLDKAPKSDASRKTLQSGKL